MKNLAFPGFLVSSAIDLIMLYTALVNSSKNFAWSNRSFVSRKYSNFGSSSSPRASKMREAVELVRELDPSFEVEGEMHADVALREELRERTPRLHDFAKGKTAY